ncbi:MAG: UDP-N-acetylmuramate dehydrogenase [Flavobacteriales bacterium]|nr:UDP-N-acetylmuramate dehydrogenase [Flavobacteriales bacterium]NCG29331.1 UDP-N-acetylmuramate dehydrogenase [Bacteroidota bacterium]MBT3964737.1 UDP-N-acetylmuramate dehydrogenase [Flavobacteriales bacterium]MBT4704718.1 UDP-N-acetylmuramate dehydrogenase [Flavobacteriales bacterium]MBT4931699.1 UDP-N-acetylmuramate dehydrogenase [Flavobacteriales bacterium]
MIIEDQVDLTPFNTFGLSAIAERLVRIRTQEDLLAYFQDFKTPSLVLGGGSNLLLTKDISGDVLRLEIPGIDIIDDSEDSVLLEVGAGVVWHEFVLHCIAQGWGGVENLSLIPGSVGAAPMQNIGAYGVDLSSVFDSLTAYLIADEVFEDFNNEACRFGYRESIFKKELRDKAVISSVRFRLQKHPTLNTSYGAIEAQLDSMGFADLSIKAISDAVIAIRRSKLPDPEEIGNSGSFFKNPVIDQLEFERLQREFPGIVGYPAGSRLVKVAAGWLIEKAGYKGKSFGNYGVHANQALVLVNHGGAKGSDVFNLSEEIIHTIDELFEIRLEREVNVI